MVQPDFDEIFKRDYRLKGRWASDFFGNDAPVVLELGCGAGEYTVELARQNPHKNFIGIDIKGARMWRGAKTATDEGLTNVAFLRTRIEFINSFFAESEVSEIWLTFSDPRLKGHQSHKRLTSPRFLERYAQFLAPEGVIHLKTDSAHLHHYTRFVVEENGLRVLECNEDIYDGGDVAAELLTIQTAYERRFVAEGLPITYLAFSLGGEREFSVGEFWGDRESGNLDERRVRKSIVEIDSHSGFCFGVVRAINAAEEFLQSHAQGYCLGEIVHNKQESSRLEQQGLRIITHSDMEALSAGETVVVRAHGEPPTTFAQAQSCGLNIVDATCPVVASLQKKVKRAWDEMQRVGGQVIILGKKGHSEVVGLTGQVEGEIIVIESAEDLAAVDLSLPTVMLSQTTQSPELFEEVKSRFQAESKVSPEQLYIFNTICRHVASRNPSLRNFASRFEVVIFVSGRHSSNGNVLFEVAREANPRTYFIENAQELQPEWLQGVRTVGISGATSTPRWLMEEVCEAVREVLGAKKQSE